MRHRSLCFDKTQNFGHVGRYLFYRDLFNCTYCIQVGIPDKIIFSVYDPHYFVCKTMLPLPGVLDKYLPIYSRTPPRKYHLLNLFIYKQHDRTKGYVFILICTAPRTKHRTCLFTVPVAHCIYTVPI